MECFSYNQGCIDELECHVFTVTKQQQQQVLHFLLHTDIEWHAHLFVRPAFRDHLEALLSIFRSNSSASAIDSTSILLDKSLTFLLPPFEIKDPSYHACIMTIMSS